MWGRSGLFQKCLLQHINVMSKTKERSTVWKISKIVGFSCSTICCGTRMVWNLIKWLFTILSLSLLLIYLHLSNICWHNSVAWSSTGLFHNLNLSGEELPAEGSMSPLPGQSVFKQQDCPVRLAWSSAAVFLSASLSSRVIVEVQYKAVLVSWLKHLDRIWFMVHQCSCLVLWVVCLWISASRLTGEWPVQVLAFWKPGQHQYIRLDQHGLSSVHLLENTFTPAIRLRCRSWSLIHEHHCTLTSCLCQNKGRLPESLIESSRAIHHQTSCWRPAELSVFRLSACHNMSEKNM